VRIVSALQPDRLADDAGRWDRQGGPSSARPRGSQWDSPEVVEGFATSPPNQVLLRLATRSFSGSGHQRLLDIGCGAGRNAVPLVGVGWHVLGSDLSEPMLLAAAARASALASPGWLRLVRAAMDHLPVATGSIDFVVAHGIWNLAGSGATFRRAVAEASRVARPGAVLFVFTFSRHTLGPEVRPVPGEQFVFTEFSGQPQCFLTEAQLVAELAAAGFDTAPGLPIVEYNRPRAGELRHQTGPVIYEGTFRRR
jgi:SAM-dependent methyltransferase